MKANITNSEIKIGVIGLGYVGWPLYKLLSNRLITIGLDIDEKYL